MAKKEAIRCALASFTPEDMGYTPVFRRPIQSVVEENTFTSFPAVLDNNIPSTIITSESSPLTESAIQGNLEYLMRYWVYALALMQPQAECVIIKRDYEYITGYSYTARGSYNFFMLNYSI